MSEDRELDASFVRGMLEARLTRRGVLKGAAFASASAFLASCGFGSSNSTGSSQQRVNWVWDKAKKTGTLDFANWPLYIDSQQNGNTTTHPSLDEFTKQTGIKVNYSEPIQDDPSFFAKVAPQLKAGTPIGYDIIVITNGIQMSDLLANRWLDELDHSKLPNFDKYAAPRLKNRSYDPGNRFTVPWQSGFTGIAYDPTKTGRDITSFKDLFDPAFAGKVGMMSANEDAGNLTLLGLGIHPQDSTPSDWRKAAAKLKQQRDAGIVRKYYDQSYIHALSSGETWISMAWSGDVFQANSSAGNEKLKFVIPKEGGLIWTDNMCIPVHAPHPLDAITFMNFVYQPDIAAMLANSINYVTPVPDSQKVLQQQAASATDSSTKQSLLQSADSPLVYPPKSELDKVYYYRTLNHNEVAEWNSIFDAVLLA